MYQFDNLLSRYMPILWINFSNVDVGKVLIKKISKIISGAYMFNINFLILLQLMSIKKYWRNLL